MITISKQVITTYQEEYTLYRTTNTELQKYHGIPNKILFHEMHLIINEEYPDE